MRIVQYIEFLRRNMKGLVRALIVYLIVLVVFDVTLSRHDAHYIIDKVYAFWTIFGIVGCFILIKVAKGIAHLFLGKDEDFYG
ncbi:MAG TPA: hypothetical protein PK125_10485 [Syntrophorhabdus sp.]|nr:hypothetical protein [Syntrophorhabdus sp.]MDI9558154.1 hypothetical protein [Pseudomonadota bacterium]OPX92770.1 MAG: hypothetical protein A4E59_02983 [Syntrophorhabdus sp. PtaB.Bin027]OQB77856.1 MAG: hypothetical protein BWX92_00497 [Deltaproteobacteria bacterium ADurb.Bin135]MBP8744971.1 hypothetical protein [Syntrophorhabdus sp.]